MARFARIDLRAQRGGVRIRQQFVHIQCATRARIAERGIANRIRETRRLDLAMQTLRAQRIAFRREAFENLQDQKRDDALPVRRTFVDLVTAKARLDRLHVLAAIAREIVQRVQPAETAQTFDDIARNRTAIERIAPRSPMISSARASSGCLCSAPALGAWPSVSMRARLTASAASTSR